MIRTLIVIVTGLVSFSSSAWAYRVIDQIEDGYELSLGMVSLPSSERGTVTFRACEDCRTTALRVTEATRYIANGVQVELGELREIAADLLATAQGREATHVYINYDIASLRVNRVRLSYRD